jgi:hypothetical protein
MCLSRILFILGGSGREKDFTQRTQRARSSQRRGAPRPTRKIGEWGTRDPSS